MKYCNFKNCFCCICNFLFFNFFETKLSHKLLFTKAKSTHKLCYYLLKVICSLIWLNLESITISTNLSSWQTCVEYWPERDSASYGNLTVTLQSTDRVGPNIIIRYLALANKDNQVMLQFIIESTKVVEVGHYGCDVGCTNGIAMGIMMIC